MNISDIIYNQIDKGALMSLGASDFGHFSNGLTFNARILPMTKNGRGTRARVMSVVITLEPSDTYSISVSYPKKGGFDRVMHYEYSGLQAIDLNAILMGLDHDGNEVTNERYWFSGE